ncbi:hypothetical protein [Modestobacter lacusdianchii]
MTQTKALSLRTVLSSVERFAEICSGAGHVYCNPEVPCVEAADLLRQQVAMDSAARAFDVGTQARSVQGEPTASWPTSALVRVVQEGLEEHPWGEGAFRRSVVITSALARLGERGLPADAVVRLCLAGRLRRRMTLHVVAAHRAVRGGRVRFDELPHQLQGWVGELGDPGRDHTGAGELEMWALTGPFATTFNRWLDEAAMAHLIDWRFNAQRVDIANEDRVLSGGSDATRWVFDRFSLTRLDDWRPASLNWEFAYVHRPVEVSRRAGVDQRWLAERRVSEEMVGEAIARRVYLPSVNGPIFADMSRAELIENFVSLVKVAALDTAIALAHKAMEAVPHVPQVGLAYAFLLIVSDPSKAESRLVRLLGNDELPVAVVHANIAMAKLRRGDERGARTALEQLPVSSDSHLAWLWRPQSLVDGPPEIAEYALATWKSEMTGVLSRG